MPKGGYHITRMLEQQGMSYATAEVLKKKFGCASPALVEKNVRLRVPASPEIGGEMVISALELAEAIELKLQEILEPLLVELKKVEGRISTVYITGGGSMLQGLAEYIQQQTTARVQYGAHNLLLHRDTEDKYLSPQYTSHDYQYDGSTPNGRTKGRCTRYEGCECVFGWHINELWDECADCAGE